MWKQTTCECVPVINIHFLLFIIVQCRSQWPRGLRRRSAAARLLRLWVRVLPGAWMSVCCECCVLSNRGLWDTLITRPEESYRLWCVVVCDLEASRMKRPWPALGRSATKLTYSKSYYRSTSRISVLKYALSKACVYSCSLSGIVGSNSTWWTDISLLWVLCVVR